MIVIFDDDLTSIFSSYTSFALITRWPWQSFCSSCITYQVLFLHTVSGAGLYTPIYEVYIYIYILFFAHFHFPASGQAVVTGVIPSPPRSLPSVFIAHRVQLSHCSSIVHRMLLTHALALSASLFVHKKKSQRIYIRVCTRRGSNPRNWPIPGSKITWYATGATGAPVYIYQTSGAGILVM